MESLASRDERTAPATPEPDAAVPAVQLLGVEKAYGLVQPRPALRGVSLRIARGECYGLAGRNGAGKTTLIKVMLGLIAPDAGEARVFGVRPDVPDIRRRVGFVPEAAELPKGASPLQLVRRWARLRGLPVQAAVAQGETNLRRLGMGDLLHRPAHRFSKGEKQRTLVVLALLGEPELLVLDEPTDGLDPLGRALVRKVILEECAQGRTVFINSHLLSETERVDVWRRELRRRPRGGDHEVVLRLEVASARLAPLLVGGQEGVAVEDRRPARGHVRPLDSSAPPSATDSSLSAG